MQVHEMLHIERGGEEQIAGELEAYNPLIPRGDTSDRNASCWRSTTPARRERELYRLAGVEDTIKLEVGGSTVAARPIEDEVARTTEDGKTSSIHFLRFPFQPAAAAALRTAGGARAARHRAPGVWPSRPHAGGDPRRPRRGPGRRQQLGHEAWH